MQFTPPVHCLNEMLFSLVCTFSNPVDSNFYRVDHPQYLQSSSIQVSTLYESSQRFYLNVPDVGPILLAKPVQQIDTSVKLAKTKPEKLKPVQQELVATRKKRKKLDADTTDNVLLASFAPSKATGLLKLIPKSIEKDSKNLFVKADGSENTSCLNKDSKIWSAMNKVRKRFGKPLIIESAYRSPAYNAALRKRSRGVAKHSQHMNCKAIDFRVDGVSMRELRTYVRSLPEIGGVGLYVRWVHMDTRAGKSNW